MANEPNAFDIDEKPSDETIAEARVGSIAELAEPSVPVDSTSQIESEAENDGSWWFRPLRLITSSPIRGDDVTKVQQILGDVTVDGIYGTETHESVARFQKKNRIPVDGTVGPVTARVMEASK